MKRGINYIRGGLIFVALVFTLCSAKATCHAAGTATFQVKGNYLQSSARDMLSKVNQFRTSGNAWYYNESNQRVAAGRLGALEIDADLEEIAMQRAMEISVRYGHERPDGSKCFTCKHNGAQSYGENIIAASYTISTEQAFNLWLEENENYSKQGHRRIMLGEGYTTIGIAHVERNGFHFWVQEFGYSRTGGALGEPLNGSRTCSVVVANSYIKSSFSESSYKKGIELKSGDSYDLGGITEKVSVTSNWGNEPPIGEVKLTGWTSSNKSVASIAGDKLIGNKAGTASISTRLSSGKTVTISVNVSGKSGSKSNSDKKGNKDTKDRKNGLIPESLSKRLTEENSCKINHVIYLVEGSEAVVAGCDKKISSVIVPKTVTIAGKEYKVTSVAERAFCNQTSLKKVNLSKADIKSIKKGAFSGCKKLKSVKLGAQGLKSIGKNAFKNTPEKAKCMIVTKKKKTYNKLVKKLEKAGMKKASFRMKKK